MDQPNNNLYTLYNPSGQIPQSQALPNTPLRPQGSTGHLNYPATPIYSTPNHQGYYANTPHNPFFYSGQTPVTPAAVDPSNIQTEAPKSRRYRTKIQKLEAVLQAMIDNGISLAEFLYLLFRVPRDSNEKIRRSKRHAAMVSRFLRGQDIYCLAVILAFWLKSPDGRPKTEEENALMYSYSTPFLDIQLGRAAITSFAVQVVENRMKYERQVASRPSSGLHAVTRMGSEYKSVDWETIGSATVSTITECLKICQPLTFHYLVELATPHPRRRHGVLVQRKYRPPEVASIWHIL